jgi:hypothetical protein
MKRIVTMNLSDTVAGGCFVGTRLLDCSGALRAKFSYYRVRKHLAFPL